MTEQEITDLGPAFGSYLRRFRGHFGQDRTAQHFDTYCRGLLSDLPRKSIEPIALAAGTAVRTLQEFLVTSEWTHAAARDTLQTDLGSVLAGLRADPMDYFRRFYADTAMFGAGHAVRCAVEFFGTDHMLFGTDMPLGGPTVVADTIADIEALGLPQAEADAIFAGNARRVLRIAG